MKNISRVLLLWMAVIFTSACFQQNRGSQDINADDILGNPDYLALSYGGYRQNTREIVPTVDELKEDMRILSAMGVKIIRTYNTSHYPQARDLLKAIRQLKEEDHSFEMYVMLGAWIDCEGARTDTINHEREDFVNNSAEIEAAVEMVNEYPDIVKIIAVGNEAMVHWAGSYFVYPDVILKWVEYLQELKSTGSLPAATWVTSSDNFASWGGGDPVYHKEDLTALLKAVDYVSMHTYPFADTHHNPAFWGTPAGEEGLPDMEKIEAAMLRAKAHAIAQYQSVANYMGSLGIDKPIHIGETGWATTSSSLFGSKGSCAADEFKQKLYYKHMREWTNEEGMACFFFEAFDEPWKDQGDSLGSENHFGLINIKGQVKYALWKMVDEGVFKGLTRNGFPITKTFGGDETKLMTDVVAPPLNGEMGSFEIASVNEAREIGDKVTEGTYVVIHESLMPDGTNDITYPSSALKLNSWEGTCAIEMSDEGIIGIKTGTGRWWGCALETVSGKSGEDLSNFQKGNLHFEMKGNAASVFQLGFQTGLFPQGDQVNNYVTFGPEQRYPVTEDWTTYSIAISEMDKGANFTDVTSIVYFMGEKDPDGEHLYIKNIHYTDH